MNHSPPLNADLHCHSVCSDGVLRPGELAARAQARGVQLWALTDHDEVAGLDEARAAAQDLGLPFIDGIEISVTWAGQTVHIVGLHIDPRNAALNAGLEGIRTGRLARARRMADALQALGIPGSYEGALAYAGNPRLVSRTHFARFLVEQGRSTHMQAAFDRYLGEGKPAYAPGDWASLAEAVGWIVAAGGRAVIAHPGRYRYDRLQFDALFDEFKQLGGQAIEVVTGSHRPDQYGQCADVARRYGFLASCGSDFHSPSESRRDLGSMPPLPPGLTPVWHDWV